MAGKGGRSFSGGSKGGRSFSSGSKGGRSFSSGSKGGRPSSPSRPTTSHQKTYHSHHVDRSPHVGRGLFTGFILGSILNKGNSNTNNNNYYDANNQNAGEYASFQNSSPQPVTCTYCGTVGGAGASKCASCGAALPVSQQPAQKSATYSYAYNQPYANDRQTYSTSTKSKKNAIIAIAVVLAVFILAIIIIASVSSDDPYFAAIGETQSTEWFDFTVNKAEKLSNSAQSGYIAVTVDVTIKNTFSTALDFYDTDFCLYIGDVSNEDYYFAEYRSSVTSLYSTMQVSAFYFEESDFDSTVYYFSLTKNETVSGRLVYFIPETTQNISFAFTEFFENGAEGETYFVSLFE